MGKLGSEPSEVIVHRGGSIERKHEVVRGAARLRAVSRAAERQRDDQRTRRRHSVSDNVAKFAACKEETPDGCMSLFFSLTGDYGPANTRGSKG